MQDEIDNTQEQEALDLTGLKDFDPEILKALDAEISNGADLVTALKAARESDANLKEQKRLAEEAARPQKELEAAQNHLAEIKAEMRRLEAIPEWKRPSENVRSKMLALRDESYEASRKVEAAEAALNRVDIQGKIQALKAEYDQLAAPIMDKFARSKPITAEERQAMLEKKNEIRALETEARFGRRLGR